MAGVDREDTTAFNLNSSRAARGGSFAERAHVLRFANRYYTKPDALSLSGGFRVARTVAAPR